jgi:polysaccharide chain length determinant protein (PEP-CTERM system associated)
MEPESGGPGLARLLEVWSRRKWLAILAVVGTFTAVATAARALPPMYRSSATVLVEQQVPESLVKPGVTSELEARLHTITQEILSRGRLRDLIERFDLYPEQRGLAPTEAVIEQMRRDIQLERRSVEQAWGRTATIAFTLSYRGGDPETVASVTNALASFYVAENTKIRERQAAGTSELLQSQLAEVKRKLDEQERRVSVFKMRHIGELPQQVEANLSILSRLNTQLQLNGEKQMRIMERRDALARQLGDPGAPAASDPDAASARLARLKQELSELRTRFSDKYPDVARLKAEIAALEDQLAPAGSPPGPGPAAQPSPPVRRDGLRVVDAELNALKDEEKRLRQAIAAYERRIENAPTRQHELLELSRDHETTKDVYQSLLKRAEEARLAESLEQERRGEQFRILDAALPTAMPYAPNRLRLLILGLLAAAGMGVGVAALAEQLDTSFHTMEALRAFASVPVLAGIPRIDTAADLGRRRWRFVLTAMSAVLTLVVIAGAVHYVAHGNEELVRLLARGKL